MVGLAIKLGLAIASQGKTILERLACLETLMTNHLEWHTSIERYFLLPILVGVIIILLKDFTLLVIKYKNNSRSRA